MTITDIAIYGGVAIAALALFFGTKWAAAKFGGANIDIAKAALIAIPDFKPGEILIYLGSAIAYDPVSNKIAIWEKSGGARLVDPSGVGSWHSGTLLTVILNRTTATPMVQLFAGPDDQKPFFKVGVLRQLDCSAWRDRLSAAFGAEKDREVHVRIAGIN